MSLLTCDKIQIRDPFVLPVAADGHYYLYGTTDKEPWRDDTGIGFDAYRSTDLQHWAGPFPIFRPGVGFWGTHHFWAPEVHAWRGRYFMFASFKGTTASRGTAILVADDPLGPFVPHSDGALTPADADCLDGTLHVAANGQPWMIFSRDWPAIRIGRYSAVPLTYDLRATGGEPIELFPVNAAPWVIVPPWAKDGPCYVADGAFPFHFADGRLALLFSSWTQSGYATGIAHSESNTLAGPWRIEAEPIFDRNGGHAMLFTDFSGQRRLTLHQPNEPAPEHPRFFACREVAGSLRLG
jgi:arabinan endo-1,5-alpha-L-arabinosidase